MEEAKPRRPRSPKGEQKPNAKGMVAVNLKVTVEVYRRMFLICEQEDRNPSNLFTHVIKTWDLPKE